MLANTFNYYEVLGTYCKIRWIQTSLGNGDETTGTEIVERGNTALILIRIIGNIYGCAFYKSI